MTISVLKFQNMLKNKKKSSKIIINRKHINDIYKKNYKNIERSFTFRSYSCLHLPTQSVLYNIACSIAGVFVITPTSIIFFSIFFSTTAWLIFLIDDWIVKWGAHCHYYPQMHLNRRLDCECSNGLLNFPYLMIYFHNRSQSPPRYLK